MVAERIMLKQKMRVKKTELEKLQDTAKELKYKVRRLGKNATAADRRGSMREFIDNAKKIKKSSLELDEVTGELKQNAFGLKIEDDVDAFGNKMDSGEDTDPEEVLRSKQRRKRQDGETEEEFRARLVKEFGQN